jgi:hypothetical protein
MISRSPHFTYNNNGLLRRAESATQDCYYCCDFAMGNWYAALGQHQPWLPQGKTPGIPTSMNNTTPEQITELWVRIDNLPNNSQYQMFKNAVQATDFIEH